MAYDELIPVEGHEELPSNRKAAAVIGGALEVMYTGMNYAFDSGSLGDAAILAVPYALVGAAMTPYIMNGIRFDYHVKRRTALGMAAVLIVGGVASNLMRDGIDSVRGTQKPDESAQEEIIRTREPTRFTDAGDELTTLKPGIMILPDAVWAGCQKLAL